MTSMQALRGIDLAREHIRAFSESDWDALMALDTPDAIYDEMATGVTLRGPATIVEGLKVWKKAFPDLKGTITRYTGDDRLLAIELTWEGTFTGELMTPQGMVKGNGTRGMVPAVQFITLEGNKIAAIDHYFDFNTILKEAGIGG